MDVIKTVWETVWDLLTNEKLLALISSIGVPLALACFTRQQNKRDKEQKKREQTVLTIAAIAKWLSIPPKGYYTEAERFELHNLVWQATLWLPDDLAKEFHNILSWKDEDVRRVLYDVRTYIRQDKKSRIRKLILCLKEVFFPQKEVFEKDDIVFFPPPKKKPE